MKILLAEDFASTARLLQILLERHGHAVTTVKDGVDALAELRRTTYDALMSDWHMPGMSGLQLIRTARSELRTPLLILLITASPDARLRKAALEAGANEILVKPVEFQEIQQQLTQWQATSGAV